MIDAFGPVEGETAWMQFQSLPDSVKQQMLSQADALPDPSQAKILMNAINSSANSLMRNALSPDAPTINVDFAKDLAQSRLRNSDDYQSTLTAADADRMRDAISEANLWLDSSMAFEPASGETAAWTRDMWIDNTLPGWAKIATPVVDKVCQSLGAVFAERFGNSFDGEIQGVFAGPVSIPIPDDMKSPAVIMRMVGALSFSLQLGSIAGSMASEVRGSYDQGLPIGDNPAGAIIVQNAKAYAGELDIEEREMFTFLALIEIAHARLYSSAQWLPSRFETLIYKYSRSITVDLDSMEEQLRDASSMDPESISGAVNLSNVAAQNTPEQQEVLASIERLLALVEGWVDCVVWRAGMAHLPHLDQLLEMRRRERVEGGPAEQTLESLIGLHVHPKTMREAQKVWDTLTADGIETRDAHWNHPDLLPDIPSDGGDGKPAQTKPKTSVDWDAELDKLLNGDEGNNHNGASDGGDSDTGGDGTDDGGDGTGGDTGTPRNPFGPLD